MRLVNFANQGGTPDGERSLEPAAVDALLVDDPAGAPDFLLGDLLL